MAEQKCPFCGALMAYTRYYCPKCKADMGFQKPEHVPAGVKSGKAILIKTPKANTNVR